MEKRKKTVNSFEKWQRRRNKHPMLDQAGFEVFRKDYFKKKGRKVAKKRKKKQKNMWNEYYPVGFLQKFSI
jgi:hypothetical protein